MSGEFAAFTEAVSKSSTATEPSVIPALSRVAVLGGGADARLLSALCLAQEAQVTLFSAYGHELELLRNSSGIYLCSLRLVRLRPDPDKDRGHRVEEHDVVRAQITLVEVAHGRH